MRRCPYFQALPTKLFQSCLQCSVTLCLIACICALTSSNLVSQTNLNLQVSNISVLGLANYQTESYSGHHDLQISDQNPFAGLSVGLMLERRKKETAPLGISIGARLDYQRYRHAYIESKWEDVLSDRTHEYRGQYEVRFLSFQLPAVVSLNVFDSNLQLLAGLTYRTILSSKINHSIERTTYYFQFGPDPNSPYYPYNPPEVLVYSRFEKHEMDHIVGTIGIKTKPVQMISKRMSLLLLIDIPIDTRFQSSIGSLERLILHLGIQAML